MVYLYFYMGLALLFLFVLVPAYASCSMNSKRKSGYRDAYFVTPWELGVPFEKISFRSGDGVVLRGWWMSRPGDRVIVGCSGLNGSKDDLVGIGTRLWSAGNNVLLFDCRDRGESDPARRTAGYRERGDISAAVRYAKERVRGARIGVIGYSMGAAASLPAAADDPGVRAVVSDSAYASLGDIISDAFRRRFLPAGLLLALSDIFTRLAFGYRLTSLKPLDSVHRISPRPLFIIHGADDSVIPADHARRLFERAGEPKELWIQEGADHCGAYFVDREKYCRRVAAFFKKHLSG